MVKYAMSLSVVKVDKLNGIEVANKEHKLEPKGKQSGWNA